MRPRRRPRGRRTSFRVRIHTCTSVKPRGLQRFPIDVLAIDRTFVDAKGAGSAVVLARAIIALGSRWHARTLAEDVEGAEQRDALRTLGFPLGQGNLFPRPVVADDLVNDLADGARASGDRDVRSGTVRYGRRCRVTR